MTDSRVPPSHADFPTSLPVDFHNTLKQDPYEWKFPSRADTMYLSTIREHDVGFNKYGVLRESRALFTRDIVDHKTRILKNESFSLKNDDIDSSCPRKLHQPLNKPYYYLRDDDIEGTKPAITKFKTKREHSNPLNPVYKLPSFEPLEPVVPKFIRDNIDINDIEGTKPKTFHQKAIASRSTNFVNDIEGARPKKDYQRKEVISPLDVRDINDFRMFKTTRLTNPLEPTYTVPAEKKGEREVIGFIDGSRSKILHPSLPHGVPNYSGSLLNQDIEGAKTGTVGNPHVKHLPRGQYRNLTDTKDILGAQTGSLKKGIQTNRHLNPLVPDYKVPGHLQDQEWVALASNGRPEFAGVRLHGKPAQPANPGVSLPAIGTPGPGSQTHLFESQLIAPEQRQAHVDGQPLELPGVAEGSRVAEPLTPAERLGRKASETSNGGQLANGLAAEQAKTPSHSAPQSAGPGKPLVKQASAYSNNQSKPLHKRIDREEFMKDAQNFYGTGGSAEEPASKVSRLVEQLESQKKVMGRLDRKMNDVYAQSKIETRKTAAQMFDKFVQTA